jgi:hypothetical protein
MPVTSVHIGLHVKKRTDEVGMSKAELARRLCMSPANVHKIFRRSSVDSALLHKLGVILEYNFFKCYQVPNALTGPVYREFEMRHFAELELRVETLEQKLQEVMSKKETE